MSSEPQYITMELKNPEVGEKFGAARNPTPKITKPSYGPPEPKK